MSIMPSIFISYSRILYKQKTKYTIYIIEISKYFTDPNYLQKHLV